MAVSDLFSLRKQLAFYGAYHSNPINIGIHMVFVPILLWTFLVIFTVLPTPAFLPAFHFTFNDYTALEMNVSTILSTVFLLYYGILDPIATLLYTPQLILTLVTATAYSKQEGHIINALILNGISWVVQVLGHTFAEGRAPALLDNLVGALVLAPFFVHIETLFSLGYRPQLQKQLKNDVGKEIARIKKIEGDKARAAKAKQT